MNGSGKQEEKKVKDQVKLKLFVKERQEHQLQQPEPLKTTNSDSSRITEVTVCKIDTEKQTLPTPTEAASSISSSSSSSKNYRSNGTFVYRPFRLFPLFLPGSHYRVFIPRKYTNIKRNLAVNRNYLWRKTAPGGQVAYTDDSDLFCVLLDQYGSEYLNLQDQDICVHVSVISLEEMTESNAYDIVDNSHDTRLVKLVTPRTWIGPHDGNYICIQKYSLGRKSVHLPKWRKRGSTGEVVVDGRQMTPNLKMKLKTVNSIAEAEEQDK